MFEAGVFTYLCVAFLFAQTPDQLKSQVLDEVDSNKSSWKDVFSGLEFDCTIKFTSLQIQNGVEQVKTTRFEMANEGTWRLDRSNLNRDEKFAWMRVGDLAFSARKPTESRTFVFGKVGESKALAMEIEQSLDKQFPFINAIKKIAGADLSTFLAYKSTRILKVEHYELPEINRSAKHIEFEAVLEGNKQVKGNVDFLGGKGSLIKRCKLELESAKPNGAPRIISDVEVDYQLFGGRLVPISLKDRSTSVFLNLTCDKVSHATSDISNFRPEAIGLKTPSSDNRTGWKPWFALAIVCCLLAIFSKLKKDNTPGTGNE